jgi:putative helicase MOV10L1
VDDYQGQEERIIFISTVLSRPESLPPARPPAASSASTGAGSGPGGDGAGSLGAAAAASAAASQAGAGDVHLGFWRNPKRFNVAVTRAKALLVVAGHPAVLLEDASWRELLRQASTVCRCRCCASAVHLSFRAVTMMEARCRLCLPASDCPRCAAAVHCWSSCRHCFSQGAYRGAGSDAILERFRIDAGAAAGALPELPAAGAGGCGRMLGAGNYGWCTQL